MRCPALGTRSSRGAGDQRGEPVRAVDRDPGVLGAPHDLHGQVERRVQRLDLVGVALVGLGDLPVERRSTGVAQPWRGEHVQVRGPERAVRGAGDVRAHERLVQRRRQLREHVRVLAHEPEELRAPRRQRDDVDQRQRAVPGPVQQVRAQRHRAAVVVRDDVRVRQLPVPEQVGEERPLRGQRDVLPVGIVDAP